MMGYSIGLARSKHPGIESTEIAGPVHGEGSMRCPKTRLLAQSQHQRNVRSVDVGIGDRLWPILARTIARSTAKWSYRLPLAGADSDDGIDTGSGCGLGGCWRDDAMSAQIASFRGSPDQGRILDYLNCSMPPAE
jgi:hypothetical protein